MSISTRRNHSRSEMTPLDWFLNHDSIRDSFKVVHSCLTFQAHQDTRFRDFDFETEVYTNVRKGTSMEQISSLVSSCAQTGPPVWSVLCRTIWGKMWSGILRTPNISPIWGAVPCQPIPTIFDTLGNLTNVIKWGVGWVCSHMKATSSILRLALPLLHMTTQSSTQMEVSTDNK